MRRILTAILVVIILAILGYVGVRYYLNQRQAANINNYQTVAAAKGSLTATVGATGTVRTNQTAVLNWETTGTIESVSVKSGDQVQSGQTLAALQQTSLPQNIILAQADLANAQKTLESLQSSKVASAQASLAISTTQKTVVDSQAALAKFNEQQYKDDLDQARKDIVDASDKLKQAKDDLEPYLTWDPENQTRKDFQKKVDDAQAVYNEKVRAEQTMVINKATAENNLAVAQAQLDEARRQYGLLKDGADPRDIAAAQARIAAAQASLDMARITAPFAGTITHVDAIVGDQAVPSKVAFRMDDLTHLLVDVPISEVDINRVQLEQGVNMTFDAIPNKEYHGTVSEVSGVGAAVQGVVDFTVTVVLADADENVKPGMTAAVNIVVQQLDNVLLIPNRAVRVLNGERVVYVLSNNQLTPVKITLGATSDNNSQITDGNLQPGDAIVLNPPVVFETNGPPPFVRR